MTRTILLAGGGTGGHVYPLVAVADALRRIDSTIRLVFIGTERGIETSVVPKRGYELGLVRVRPIRGGGLAGAMRGVFGAFAALPESRRLLLRYRPSALLSVGGYAAGPISAMARWLGIPLALLEPNAALGLSNRLIAPLVARAYTAFAPAERAFEPSRVRRLGVPIREGFDPDTWQWESRPWRILVLGGSQGARTLNESVPAALVQQRVSLSVRHQCGQRDVAAVRERYAVSGLANAKVEPYIDDMPAALREADLVISRSGASAVSEITAVGRASLLVPYPFAADNHQQRNAESVADAGAARWIHNSDASPSRLAREIQELLADPTHMLEMATKARAFGRPDAARRIAIDLLQLAQLEQPAASRENGPPDAQAFDTLASNSLTSDFRTPDPRTKEST